MTVSSTTSRWSYTGNGTTGPFAYTTKIFEKTDLKVYVANVLKTVDTHYTVSGLLSESGGNVTFTGGNEPANGASVVIVKDVPNTQGTSLPLGGSLPSTAIEAALDKLTILVQQIYKRATSRILRQPDSDATDISELPAASVRANTLLGFDSNGQPTATSVANVTALNLTGKALNMIRVQSDEEDFEFRTPSQVVTDLGLDQTVTSAALRGWVNVYPAETANGDSTIILPDGSELDQTGTTTNGLQEAVDHCRAKGYNLKVHALNGSPTDFMFQYMGAWGTTTAYGLQQIVLQNSVYYRCIVAHTSGTFATDLAANKWEVFDYAATGLGIPTGWPTINGKAINYRNTAYYMSTGLTIGSSQSMVFDFSEITIVHTATSGNAVTLDSAYQSKFLFGTIVLSNSNTTGRALKIAPTTNNEFLDGLIYGVIAFFHCHVEAMNLATISTDTAVGFEADAGAYAITENYFKLNEVEGGLACVRLVHPTGTGAIRGNTFDINRLYGPDVSGNFALIIGTATSGGNVYDNKFRIGNIMCLDTGAKGIQIYGDNNYVLASINAEEAGGDISQGARFESSASRNTVIMPRCDATTPVSDASTDTSNTYQYEEYFQAPQVLPVNQQRFFAFKSSATNNVTGNGTLYTVICDTEREDAGSNYNNSTGVYTAALTRPHSFSFGLCFTGLTSSHTKAEVFLSTSNREYAVAQFNIGAVRDSGNVWCGEWTVAGVDVDAADTASVKVRISNGGSDDADLYGQAGSAIYTFFSGRML